MSAIGVLIKPASGLCNMNCDYCFYCDEAEKRKCKSYGMMSEATLKNVIRKTLLRSEGMYSIAFQGGEPTLCGLDFFKKVIEYLDKYNKNNCRISLALQTNGYGINEDWAKFFADNNFLVGISVDGIREIHNKYRHANDGGDTYEHVLNATKLFDKFNVQYNVLTVVHREIAQNVDKLYQNFKERGWNYLQFINCLDPLGEPRGQKEYSLLPKDYEEFLKKLFDLWYEDAKAGKQPYIRQFENYIGILLGYAPESCEQRGICDRQLVVEADGSVFPCDFYVLDDYKLGNFNEDRLPEIDAKREEIGFVQRSLKLPQECKECKWFRLCKGACYRNRMTEEGGDGRNYFCEAYKGFFEYSYERFLEVIEIYKGGKG